jgi:enoyl-CoA hydratase/carnithine racemase
MLDDLYAFFTERLTDFETRVLIMKGAGTVWCSGADIKEPAINMLDNPSPAVVYTGQRRYSEIILLMRRVPQPIIAAVQGPAMGAGFSFALACDIRIATDKARFVGTYINIGLGGADMGSSYLLPRLIGSARAYRYLLTGDDIWPPEAEKIGLVSEVVPEGELEKVVTELAQKMCTKNPLGLRMTKEALNQNLNAGSLEQALLLEDRNQTMLLLAFPQALHR